jgi:acyl-coenzyme A thioesterase PaaI-like protein
MTSMHSHNKLSRLVSKVNSAPAFCRSWLLTLLFGRTIKFAGTAGVKVESLDFQQAKLRLANRSKVQNHIGSVHAAATALLGESASGFLLGMHVADDKIPLLKSMQIQYLKRSTGALMAQAQLDDAQISQIRSTDKGEVVIRVLIKDQLGVEPVEALYTWAWIPKTRK